MPGPTDLLSSNPVGLAVNAGVGLVDTAIGLIDAHKAKKEAAILAKERPVRQISPEVTKNLGLTESELAGGMGAAATKAYNDAVDREQAGSISAILRGGGSVNSISDVYGAGEEGRQRLATITNQLRLNQISNLMKARETMTNEEDKNFLFNKWAPYADRAQAVGQERQAANKQIFSGLQTLAGGVGDLFGEKSNPSNNGGDSGGGFSGLDSFSNIDANVRRPSATMASFGGLGNGMPSELQPMDNNDILTEDFFK